MRDSGPIRARIVALGIQKSELNLPRPPNIKYSQDIIIYHIVAAFNVRGVGWV